MDKWVLFRILHCIKMCHILHILCQKLTQLNVKQKFVTLLFFHRLHHFHSTQLCYACNIITRHIFLQWANLVLWLKIFKSLFRSYFLALKLLLNKILLRNKITCNDKASGRLLALLNKKTSIVITSLRVENILISKINSF